VRALHIYLAGYFVLLLGAALSLWRGGILERISGFWIMVAAVIAVGLGILLAVSAGTDVTTES
jgi:uncharacterized membrane protein